MKKQIVTYALITALGVSGVFFAGKQAKAQNSESDDVDKTYNCGDVEYTYRELSANSCEIIHVEILKDSVNELNFPETIDNMKVTTIDGDPDWNGGQPDLKRNIIGLYEPDEGSNWYGDDQRKILHNSMNRITKIVIPNSVKSIKRAALGGFSNLKSVELSQNLVELEKSNFKDTPLLKKIFVPSKVKYGIVELAKSKSWDSFEIDSDNSYYKVKNSQILSKNGKILYGFSKKKKKVNVENSVKTIEGIGNTPGKLVISKNVTKIKSKALAGSVSYKLSISKKNKKYFISENNLIQRKDKKLVAIVAKNKAFVVSGKVKKIRKDVSYIGDIVKDYVVIPSSKITLKGYWQPSSYSCVRVKGTNIPFLDRDAMCCFEISVKKSMVKKYQKRLKKYGLTGDVTLKEWGN